MATAIETWLGAATANNVRANNQWEAEFISGYQDVDAVLKDAVMFGTNFTIPGRSIAYADVSYKGFTTHNLVPTHIEMDYEHSMTVTCDIKGEYRRAFLKWQNYVMNMDIEGGSLFEGNRGVNPNSSARIHLFGADNKTISETYKLVNFCITNVGPVELVYDGGDKATFSITGRSTYWYIEKAADGRLAEQR